MTDLTSILRMNSKQLICLLENHEMFTYDEVKLAAKMKVKNDKKCDYGLFEDQQRCLNQLQAYNRQSLGIDMYRSGQAQVNTYNLFGGLL